EPVRERKTLRPSMRNTTLLTCSCDYLLIMNQAALYLALGMIPNREARMEPDVWSRDQFDIAPDMTTVATPAGRRASWYARVLVWLFGVWAVVIALFFLL